jgi:hypothetical protein
MSQGEFQMQISSYQMHNVLNVYSKQLSRNESSDKTKTQIKKTLTDQISLSPEGKRKSTLDKVYKEILNNISSLGKNAATDRFEGNHSQDGQASTVESNVSKENEFVFNVIDKVNTKKTTKLSAKDSNFLINRLEQLAKEAVEKKGDTADKI